LKQRANVLPPFAALPPAAAIPAAAAAAAAAAIEIDDSYSSDQFKDMMDKAVQESFGHSLETLEGCSAMRKANKSIEKDDSNFQASAMYGRATQELVNRLSDELGLNPAMDVFGDIGAGAGTVPLQVAYTQKCDVRGIEFVSDRYDVGVALQNNLKQQHEGHDNKDLKTIGTISLRKGRLELEENREFLTVPGPGRSCMKLFCNNFNGNFAYKSANPGSKWYLDHLVASIFAETPPGSILITLHELPIDIAPRRLAMKSLRNRLWTNHDNIGRDNDPNASFYDVEEIDLGDYSKCVSWASPSENESLKGYKYTRLEQRDPNGKAVFLCSNPECPKAKAGTPITATETITVKSKKRQAVTETRLVLRAKCDGCSGALNVRASRSRG